MNTIRIFLADDHRIFREGLRSLLEQQHDIEIVGESGDGDGAVAGAVELRPSMIIMDVMMPGTDGIQAARQIGRSAPDVKVVILSMLADEDVVRRALNAGVRGYLVKSTAAGELLNAIREIERGHAFFSPLISGIILRIRQSTPDVPVLTRREEEVLQMICDGKTNKEIGLLLNISHKTVSKHRQQIMSKFGVHDVVHLLNFAREKKLIR